MWRFPLDPAELLSRFFWGWRHMSGCSRFPCCSKIHQDAKLRNCFVPVRRVIGIQAWKSHRQLVINGELIANTVKIRLCTCNFKCLRHDMQLNLLFCACQQIMRAQNLFESMSKTPSCNVLPLWLKSIGEAATFFKLMIVWSRKRAMRVGALRSCPPLSVLNASDLGTLVKWQGCNCKDSTRGFLVNDV